MAYEDSATTYEYHDSDISMQVPSYLRSRRGLPLFTTRSRKDKVHPILHFTIGLIEDALVEGVIRGISVAQSSDEWLGLKGRVIRRGRVSYLKEGVEMLSSAFNAMSGQAHHGYNILFLLNGRRIYGQFFGQGDLEIFDRSCQGIVSSVRLLDGKQ